MTDSPVEATMPDTDDPQKQLYQNEALSIKRNERHIRKCRARTGRFNHPGYEYVWYETWTATLTRATLSLGSTNVAPQLRLFMRKRDRNGVPRTASCIPDFGLIRYAEYVRKVENGIEVIKRKRCSRLVLIVEVKRPPPDNSPTRVFSSLAHAYADLRNQVEIFFAGRPDVHEIVGVSAAGVYWQFEVFTRDSVGSDDEDEDEDGDNDNDGDGDGSGSDTDDSSHVSSSESNSSESWSGESNDSDDSSPDELDIIDKPDDPTRQELEANDGDGGSEGSEDTLDLEDVYTLQTEGGEEGLALLIEAIKNLGGCEVFDETTS